MRLRQFASIAALFYGGFIGISHGQEIPNLNKDLEKQLSTLDIPEEKLRIYNNEFRVRVRRNLPRVIFVPGILGSKINECRSDGSQCKNIWGTAGSVTDSSIELNIRDDRKYITDVVDEIFFKKVYGGILDDIRIKATDYVEDLNIDPILNVFHYDWRQSNVITSQRLKEYVCLVSSHSSQSPIIIVAHSMGGLATKLWLKDHASEDCEGANTKPNLVRVVFIGTPHLGAPKTIKAIANGYNVLFDEIEYLDVFRRKLRFWEENYLLGSLNRSGMTFQSLYELLPIQTSQKCVNDTIKKLNKIQPVPVVDKVGSSIDLFDVETWIRFDLLKKRIENDAVRFAFYRDSLPKYLDSAQKTLCSLMEYDPAKQVDVMYVVGNLQKNSTFGWFRLGTESGSPIIADKKTAGDGTVPDYSARNVSVSTSAQVPSTLPLGHMQLASSSLLLERIADWFRTSYERTKLALVTGDKQLQTLIAAEAAVKGQLLSIPTDASKWTGADFELRVAINTENIEVDGANTIKPRLFSGGG